MNFNREEIFNLIYQKQWIELIRLLHEKGDSISKSGDEIVITAIKTFIEQFMCEVKSDGCNKYIDQLHMLFSMHRTEILKISDEDFNSIVVKLANYYAQSNLEEAKYYADFSPKHPFCADIIKRYSETSPLIINHSQVQAVQVTTRQNISQVDATVSLFKSRQEKDFFLALCQLFPRLDVYPNVALSCLINYEVIKDDLSIKEKDFFYKGIVDCVVFDRTKYNPIYFFELDSDYHDNKIQTEKDGYKDNIISRAGQKLYRIRKKRSDIGIEHFVNLLNDILDIQ